MYTCPDVAVLSPNGRWSVGIPDPRRSTNWWIEHNKIATISAVLQQVVFGSICRRSSTTPPNWWQRTTSACNLSTRTGMHIELYEIIHTRATVQYAVMSRITNPQPNQHTVVRFAKSSRRLVMDCDNVIIWYRQLVSCDQEYDAILRMTHYKWCINNCYHSHHSLDGMNTRAHIFKMRELNRPREYMIRLWVQEWEWVPSYSFH